MGIVSFKQQWEQTENLKTLRVLNNFKMYSNDWNGMCNTFHKMMNLFKRKFEKKISPELQLVFYTRKWIWCTIKFSTKKIRKEQMYVFPTIDMQENTFCIIFKWIFFWDFWDFKIKKRFATEEDFSMKKDNIRGTALH